MFNSNEIDILMEALDAWESKDSMSDLLVTMLGAGMAKDEASRDSYLEERQIEMEKRKLEQRTRKEQAILIKAKLIQMRDRADIEELDMEVIRD